MPLHPPRNAPRRIASPLGLAVAILLLPLFLSCRDGGRDREPGPSVLLVVVDTLRADRLGSYGNERGLTPCLDRFAARSFLFEHASSHAPWTLPATASLYTSQLPSQHGAGGRAPSFTGLGPSAPTAASVFADAGYATAAFVNVGFLGKDFGMHRGFAHFDEESRSSTGRDRDAVETTDSALAWLGEERTQPFFLLVHYFDPHAPYDPAPPFRKRFAAPSDSEPGSFIYGTGAHLRRLRDGDLVLAPEIIGRAEALYDAEVAYTDAEIGRLFDGLAELGLAEGTCVVVTADHGEEFLDHGGFEHGHSLYAELVHVPLLLHVPGLSPGRSAAVVRHVDLLPTLCAITGTSGRSTFEGTSLVPLLGDPAGASRTVLTEGNRWGPTMVGWYDGEHQLITAGSKRELYRWPEDLGQETDLAASDPERVRVLHETLGTELARLAARRGERAAEVEIGADGLDALRDLGYVGGDDDEPDADSDADSDDGEGR